MREDAEAARQEGPNVRTEDIKAFDYVRRSVHYAARTRRGPVVWRGAGRRVGYAVLRSEAPSHDVPGHFVRRVFWVKEQGRSAQPAGMCRRSAPAEVVDPAMAPGVWGELTERAWGAPLGGD